ncbi:7-cyano-7-deazaguanine synthase QueC [Caldicellulosiruptor naganoensis]|uniref:7-cyano-7-deazaguanine synthase n=1 Tax=Caldicellulosiruptor naganoensis TaxID=29324 RepID=A0ABY7BI71_9FIRM|nr:7-cyano-7-deazaguanine synthase QueC [Caldicellulosiruptor naganoensis]WAM31751.1 7-cyano-7-deazaguanine synthase QueC [Caldicellulosiruptor naganoensis]
MRALVVLSGGMDSTTLLYDVKNKGYETYAISFNYGQKHAKELEFAKKTCELLKVPHKIVDISFFAELAPSALTVASWQIPEGYYTDETMKQTVVPNRNMVLLSLATAYAISIKAQKLFYGAHAGDHPIYPDCRKEFVEAMKKAIYLCDYHTVELEAPYIDLKKEDILNIGLKLGVDYSLTWSCYKGGQKACGRCGTCTERIEAFKKVGVKDPIEYEVEIEWE